MIETSGFGSIALAFAAVTIMSVLATLHVATFIFSLCKDYPKNRRKFFKVNLISFLNLSLFGFISALVMSRSNFYDEFRSIFSILFEIFFVIQLFILTPYTIYLFFKKK